MFAIFKKNENVKEYSLVFKVHILFWFHLSLGNYTFDKINLKYWYIRSMIFFKNPYVK